MTVEIEPDAIAETEGHAKEWLDHETEFYERVLKERRIVETLYSEEHRKSMALMLGALNTVPNK